MAQRGPRRDPLEGRLELHAVDYAAGRLSYPEFVVEVDRTLRLARPAPPVPPPAVEEAARALAGAEGGSWALLDGEGRDRCRELARAALEAGLPLCGLME